MQTGTVTGTVKDKKGHAQIGAEVTVEDTDLIAITDMEGAFDFPKVPTGGQVLIASMVIGKTEAKVDVVADETVAVDLIINPMRPG